MSNSKILWQVALVSHRDITVTWQQKCLFSRDTRRDSSANSLLYSLSKSSIYCYYCSFAEQERRQVFSSGWIFFLEKKRHGKIAAHDGKIAAHDGKIAAHEQSEVHGNGILDARNLRGSK